MPVAAPGTRKRARGGRGRPKAPAAQQPQQQHVPVANPAPHATFSGAAQATPSCAFCNRPGHAAADCRGLMKKSVFDIKCWLQLKRRCFGCYQLYSPAHVCHAVCPLCLAGARTQPHHVVLHFQPGRVAIPPGYTPITADAASATPTAPAAPNAPAATSNRGNGRGRGRGGGRGGRGKAPQAAATGQ